MVVDSPVIEPLDARKDFQQSGLACAVAADDADALLRRDEPVQILKKYFGAEAFAGLGELNHVCLGNGVRANTAIVPQAPRRRRVHRW